MTLILVMTITTTHVCQGDKRAGRQKRIVWITTDGRLALPPGTLLTITPTISMPFVRYPPDGFLSNMTISLPFTINFDVLGLTDNQNPYGALPPIIARGLGRSAGAVVADYIASLLNKKRSSRSAEQSVISEASALFHGGERAILYIVVEDFLANFGLNGKACLLRAICEVHVHSLRTYGIFGEMIKLFFTASKSPFAESLSEYVKAERLGLEQGECFPYYKDCPKSLFSHPSKNKYVNNHEEEEEDFNAEENEVIMDEKPNRSGMTNDVLQNVIM